MERLTYDFALGGNHCWQVKGADNLECREVCERQGDDGCKTCPIAKAFDRLAAIEDILGDEYNLERLKFIMDAERHGGLIVRYPRDDPGPKGPPVFAPVAGDTRGYPGTQKQTYLLVLCAAGPIQRPHYGGSRNDRD